MLSYISHIVIFAFNRPSILSRTLVALAANELAAESDVTIFCDGPRTTAEKDKTDAVRAVAHQASGFASVHVIEREKNFGCAASVIDGLTQMFTKYERLIVIEDDILTSPYTLRYLNDGLEFYKDRKTIFNISAWSPPAKIFPIPEDYPYDVYAIPRFNCWGWASWRDRFLNIDWNVSEYQEFRNSQILRKAFNAGGDDMSPMLDAQMRGELNTWDIRADYARFKQGQLGINPVFSYTTNIGMDSGVHCTEGTTRLDNDICKAKGKYTFLPIIFCDERIKNAYHNIYGYDNILRKMKLSVIFFLKYIAKKIGIFDLLKTIYYKLK